MLAVLRLEPFAGADKGFLLEAVTTLAPLKLRSLLVQYSLLITQLVLTPVLVSRRLCTALVHSSRFSSNLVLELSHPLRPVRFSFLRLRI